MGFPTNYAKTLMEEPVIGTYICYLFKVTGHPFISLSNFVGH